jgi:hypothetical protein
MEDEYLDEGEEIDWENPFSEIRSSEITDITLTFNNNGKKVIKFDDKGEEYSQFKFDCVREDISNPSGVLFTTSSKRLVEDIALLAPIKGKKVQIIKTGSGFQTKYKVKELK